MGSWSAFLFAYLLGGVTFIPLALAVVFVHIYLTLPVRNDADETNRDPRGDIVHPEDHIPTPNDAQEKRDDAKARGADEPDVAAGYFAVCREYTPMGINAKPIERSTPVGSAAVTAPSPSVYQTMYRSIFERKQASSPLNDKGAVNQRPKRAGNVFYVVLRHGHLMLFDDDEQLEVRHVVSLAHHDVNIYSGGDATPEGELYIKKNAICLSRRTDKATLAPDAQISKPFYLFSENCSAKEDFYFALLRSQEHTIGADKQLPEPLRYDVKDIVSLVQKLHSAEDNINTRWLNALIGRVFLSVYKTRDLENLIREKLTKKISRVKRPSFLSHIVIRHIHTGNSAPYVSNPRLKDLNVDGECVIEADIRYTGNFRIEVATTAKIDLGSRFKVREVDLVLAVVLRKIDGHGLFKIKAPPSNRFWFAFQSMPKMEMSIEPIVSSRQITYTMILRQIENRIKEVVAESVVLPFWDDTPFFDTEGKSWRGGIWTADHESATPPNIEVVDAPDTEVGEASDRRNALDILEAKDSPFIEKSYTEPLIAKSPTSALFGRKKSAKSLASNFRAAATGSDTSLAPSSASWPAPSRSAADAVVAQDSARGEPVPGLKEAPASALAALSAVAGTSPPKSSTSTPLGSPIKSPPPVAKGSAGAHHPAPSHNEQECKSVREALSATEPLDRRNTNSSTESVDTIGSGIHEKASSLKSHAGSISRGLFRREETNSSMGSSSAAGSEGTGNTKNITLAAVSNAALQAKQWGLNAFQRSRDKSDQNHSSVEDHSIYRPHFNNHGVDLTQPMGRGRPLPPPGTPLPPPERLPRKSSNSISMPKRKNLPPPLLPERRVPERHAEERPDTHAKRAVPAPPLPKRRVLDGERDNPAEENVFVVEAPLDSEPTSPSGEALGAFNSDVRATPPVEGTEPGENKESGQTTSGDGTTGDKESESYIDDLSSVNTPITAVPVEREEQEEDDGGYSGWLEDLHFDDEPLGGAATELAAATNTA